MNLLNFLHYFSFSDGTAKFNSQSAFKELECTAISFSFFVEAPTNVLLRNKLYILLYILSFYCPKIKYSILSTSQRQSKPSLNLKVSITKYSRILEYLISFFLETWNAVEADTPRTSFQSSIFSPNQNNITVWTLGVSGKAYFSTISDLLFNLNKEILFISFKFKSRTLNEGEICSRLAMVPLFWKMGKGRNLLQFFQPG